MICFKYCVNDPLLNWYIISLTSGFFHYYILRGSSTFEVSKNRFSPFMHISNLDVTRNVLCKGFYQKHDSSRVFDRHSWPPAIFSRAWRFKRVSTKVMFSKSFGKSPYKMFGTLGISNFPADISLHGEIFY